jgi:hypothetical protein
MGRIGLTLAVFALLGAPDSLDPEADKGGDISASPPNKKGSLVAVLDVAKAVKECQYFKEHIRALKAEADPVFARMKRKAEEIRRDMESGDLLLPDPAKRKAREQFNTEIAKLRLSFLRREAEIYRRVRDELQNQAKMYCEENELAGPVFSSASSDHGTEARPPYRDITDAVIERLNSHLAKERAEQGNGPAGKRAKPNRNSGLKRDSDNRVAPASPESGEEALSQ